MVSASSMAARAVTAQPRFAGRRACALALLLLSGLLLVQALWIPAKAGLAQWLLARSWDEARAQGEAQPPWAWADTRAVALLRRAGEPDGQIVLAGDSGRVLAFGPGWNEASSAPGTPGTVVISAHRDTHFAWLRDVVPGTRVELQGLHGTRRYRLQDRRVVDVREHALAPDAAEDQLLLVTRWPFDAVDAGGPLRLVLRFSPMAGPTPTVSPAAATPSPPHTPVSRRSDGAGTGSSHRG